MRRTAPTPNRVRRQAAVGVSLFPFLAVLICTMGALILLLVVIARQARIQAAQAAAEETAEREDAFQAERETVQWRIEQLRHSRRQTLSQLAEVRLSLGQLEDHARRLRDQLARLQQSYDDLGQLGSDGSRQRRKLEAELEQLNAQIAEAQRLLADARQAAARRRHSYAVVPYQGPHETHRRPIYIECRPEAILLQPEGIVLREEDFLGPMGPGNPLAAALRATREYLLEQSGFHPEPSGDPYPLLLVRPSGIAAYYAARAAMEAWGSEFGYELIGQDWQLDFPSPDPQLAEVMRQAVETARVRQERLAAAAPRHYGKPRGTQYRASPTRGGVVRDGGSPGGARAGFRLHQPARAFGGRFGSAGGNPLNPRSPSEGAVAGRPPTEQQPPLTGQGGRAIRPGEWQPGGASAVDPSAHGQHGQPLRSLAETRGRDWGLPDAAAGSVPITRPIRIECHDDRLVIPPETGLGGEKSIPLGLRIEDSIDRFISAIWEHMESWGIAGNGMYWRPILNVHVAPNAEQRYADLQVLLDGSGLTVQRRK